MVFGLRLLWQAVRSICTGAIFWTATRFSMFVEAVCRKAAVNSSVSPFCSYNAVFRELNGIQTSGLDTNTT
jgi:hypothetical protein